jgi:hypothetical protein
MGTGFEEDDTGRAPAELAGGYGKIFPAAKFGPAGWLPG